MTDYSYGDPSRYTAPTRGVPITIEDHQDGNITMDVGFHRFILTPDEADDFAKILMKAANDARARTI